MQQSFMRTCAIAILTLSLIFAGAAIQTAAPSNVAAQSIMSEQAGNEPASVDCLINCEQVYAPMIATELINEIRVNAGCPALEYDEKLSEIAEEHSYDMARNNFFSHTNLRGQNVVARARAVGYVYTWIGENIAAGSTTPEQVVDRWMRSPDHRDNILNCNFTEGALALSVNSNSQYTYYWTHVFGSQGGFGLVPSPPSVSDPVIVPAPFAVNLSSSTIAENKPKFTIIGRLSTEDLDLPDDSHVYTLVRNDEFPDNAAFYIEGDKLRSKRPFDFESQSSYTIRIRSTDSAGYTFGETFVIDVIDVDDDPAIQNVYVPFISR